MPLPIALLLAAGPLPAAAAVDTPALNAYAQARLAEESGEPARAVNSYRLAFASDPSDPSLAFRSYRQAMKAGDMALALRAARVLDAAGALTKDGALLFLVDALNRKDWKAARTLCTRLQSEENFAFMTPLIESWVSIGEGDYHLPALDTAAPGLALTRRYVDEHVALQLLQLRHPDQAQPFIDRLFTVRDEDLTGLRLALAQRLAQLGRTREALAILPESMPALASTRAAVAGGAKVVVPPLTPAQGVARLLARLGDDVGAGEPQTIALILARLATFADPGNPELRLGLARRLDAADLPDLAFEEAGKVDPRSVFALAAQDARVDALLESDRSDEALALTRELAARPDAGTAQQMRLGNVLADRKQFPEAVEAYRAAQASYPEDGVPWTLYLLEGSALEQGGRWDEARAALEKALALAPEEPVVLNYLGYAQVERRQNVPAALKLLRKASALKPDDPSITDSLGWAHFIAGDTREAVPVLERAAAAAPDDVTINEHLGDALWTVGRRYEARYAWTAASTFAEGALADRLAAKVKEGLTPATAAR